MVGERLFTAAGIAFLLLASAAATGATPSKGTRIVSVRAVPAATQLGRGVLSRRRLNTVTASTALGFRIAIRNESSAGTRNESVSLIIRRPVGASILIAKRLPTIGPGQTKTLTFSNLGSVPFATATRITVSLRTGATNSYLVIFSLPTANFGVIPAPARPALVSVPDLLATQQTSAVARLESLGLEILLDPVPSARPVGVVLAESPSAGSRISRGSIVKLTVSA